MRHHAVVQGSEEWKRLHMGVPSASAFDRILTPARLELSKIARHTYAIEMLTELILDMPLATVTTAAMQKGHIWEPKAVAAYELEMGVDTEICGFCTTDDGRIGASPDRFVGDDGLLEVKSPEKPEIHVGYLLDNSKLVDAYNLQVQGQLLVCQRKWCDLISYFTGLPMVRVRIEPDPKVQEALDSALKLFLDELQARISVARDKGWIRERAPGEERSFDKDFLNDADLDAILEARKGQ